MPSGADKLRLGPAVTSAAGGRRVLHLQPRTEIRLASTENLVGPCRIRESIDSYV